MTFPPHCRLALLRSAGIAAVLALSSVSMSPDMARATLQDDSVENQSSQPSAANSDAANRSPANDRDPLNTFETSIDFARDIQPILANHCFTCHGKDEASRQGGLRLDLSGSATSPADSGEIAIVPGSLAHSHLVARIDSTDDALMPPAEFDKPLSESQRKLLKQWIESGAPYAAHWAFLPPQDSPLPEVARPDWSNSTIDHYIQKQLNAHGLDPAPSASRELWLRRVTLDLTGVPPTLAERERFLNDSAPDAFDRVVDRLLASPAHAERMANQWLDASRFADTNGYNNDETRSMWPWRDWVIQAYRDDLAYDQFLTQQLAGDLLPSATLDQKVATGFVRNHVLTTEGGIIEEEYQAEYVADRVHTVATVFMGLSLQCARCHDHKYDPFSQTDYYRFAAFFNNVPDRIVGYDQGKMAEPLLSVPTAEQSRLLAEYESQRQTLEEDLARLSQPTPETQRRIADWEASLTEAEIQALGSAAAIAHFSMSPSNPDPAAALSIVDRLHLERPLQIHGTPAAVTGVVEQALEFNGSNWIEVPDLGAFHADDSFTLSAWIRPAQLNAGTVLSRIDDQNSYRGYDIVIEDGKVAAHFIDHWSDRGFKILSNTVLEVNEWQHIALVYSGTRRSDGVQLYIDGNPTEFTVTTDGEVSDSLFTDQPFRIGRRSTGLNFVGAIDEVRVFAAALDHDSVTTVLGGGEPSNWSELFAIPSSQRTEAQRAAIAGLFLDRIDPQLKRLRSELQQLAASTEQVRSQIPQTMIMGEMSPRRPTHLLIRGQYDRKGDAVNPGLPAAFAQDSALAEETALTENSAPLDTETTASRLDLAHWLTSGKHPLTSRVAVNRLWEMMFGTGLVETSEDFGIQGSQPSHPELLDRLAMELQSNDWSQRLILREIALSAAYRQSSYASAIVLERDPENRWLSRGPRYRLSAEGVRDNALAIAGLLDSRSGGPSVKPYQPEGLWEDVSVERRETYVVSEGADLYRRSMYTFWKRTCPPPTMSSFDAPDRETCVVRRARTNTPLQALVLLNDPTYVEAARVFAEQALQSADNDQHRLEWAYLTALCRRPTESESSVLLDLLQQARQRYADQPDAALALLSIGKASRNPNLDSNEAAAWTIITDMILNLDEAISKP